MAEPKQQAARLRPPVAILGQLAEAKRRAVLPSRRTRAARSQSAQQAAERQRVAQFLSAVRRAPRAQMVLEASWARVVR